MQELRVTSRTDLEKFQQSYEVFRARNTEEEPEVPSEQAPAANNAPSEPECEPVAIPRNSPQAYAEKKRQMMRNAKARQSPYTQQAAYKDPNKPYFAPTKRYIYSSAAATNQHLVNYNAASIGQTTYLPLQEHNARTEWSQKWNQTQYANDTCGRRATCGFENLSSQFIIDGGVAVDCSSGKLIDAEVCADALNSRKLHFAASTLSQTRAELSENPGAAFALAYDDCQKAHQRWLEDRQKGAPIALDPVEPAESVAQVQEQRFLRDKSIVEQGELGVLRQKAIKTANELYGEDSEKWVDSLTINRVKQLAAIGEAAMEAGVVTDGQPVKKIPQHFYMAK